MKATKGNKVRVHYTGTLDDGTQFDSSREREPLEFEVGAGQMIKGFDQAVDGMVVGGQKSVTIPAAEAYGDRKEDLLQELPKSDLPDEIKPEVGMKLQMKNEDGRQMPVTIVDVVDEKVVLDANHELAGKDLTFDIELVEIV